MRTFWITSCILAIMMISCNQQTISIKEIYVKGCVIDNTTKMPIPDAKVTVLCWYHAGWDKTDYVSIDTIADKNGCFDAKFEEGYKVIVASVASKYVPNLTESEKFDVYRVAITIELKKRSDTTNVNSSINLRNYIIQNSDN